MSVTKTQSCRSCSRQEVVTGKMGCPGGAKADGRLESIRSAGRRPGVLAETEQWALRAVARCLVVTHTLAVLRGVGVTVR
jgi:hypothetical protein